MKITRTIKNSRGFTLIELMITVAIVGILTAIALPAYQDYSIRSQVSEGLSLVSGAKPVVGEYFANYGEYPTNEEAGFAGYMGKFIDKTEIGEDGKIIATFGNQANSKISGQTVTLIPEADTMTGNIKWSCQSSANAKYLPTSCNNDGVTGNPGNPGGGTDPEQGGGPTTPTTFDTSVYGIYSSSPLSFYTYRYYDSYMTQDWMGSWTTLNKVIVSSGGQIYYADSESSDGINYKLAGGETLSIMKNGDMLQTFAPQNGITKTALYLDGTGSISYNGYSSLEGGSVNTISYPGSETPFTVVSWKDFVYQKGQSYGVPGNARDLMSKYTTASNNIIKGTATSQQISDFNTASTNLTSYLADLKNQGVTLDRTSLAFLKLNGIE